MKLVTLVVLFFSSVALAHPASLPRWSSPDLAQEAFELIRDTRIIPDPHAQGVLRRMNWISPGGVCSQRAYMSALLLHEANRFPGVSQVFIEGELRAEPLWRPGPRPYLWTFHQAPGFQMNGVDYVIDPAFDSWGPMPLQEWIKKLNPVGDYRLTFCAPFALDPDQSCKRTHPLPRKYLDQIKEHLLIGFLEERQFVLGFGSEPSYILGDFPPWRGNEWCRKSPSPESPKWQAATDARGQGVSWRPTLPLQDGVLLTKQFSFRNEGARWVRLHVKKDFPGFQVFFRMQAGFRYELERSFFATGDGSPENSFTTAPLCVSNMGGLRLSILPEAQSDVARFDDLEIDRVEVHPEVR